MILISIIIMEKIEKRKLRKKRIRRKVFGETIRPRFSVFRSNKYIYAQLIDDDKGVTLVSESDLEFKSSSLSSLSKKELAYKVGESLAKKALKKKIKKVVFDRGGYKYHGRVKALAEGARKGGLEF